VNFYNLFPVYLLEPVESGETLDAESLSELLLSGGVHLGESDWWIVLRKDFGSSGVLRLESLAVTTKEKMRRWFIGLHIGSEINTYHQGA